MPLAGGGGDHDLLVRTVTGRPYARIGSLVPVEPRASRSAASGTSVRGRSKRPCLSRNADGPSGRPASSLDTAASQSRTKAHQAPGAMSWTIRTYRSSRGPPPATASMNKVLACPERTTDQPRCHRRNDARCDVAHGSTTASPWSWQHHTVSQPTCHVSSTRSASSASMSTAAPAGVVSRTVGCSITRGPHGPAQTGCGATVSVPAPDARSAPCRCRRAR